MSIQHPKKGVLLINLGTPDSPETKDVRRYLREFLMDRRVLDIPAIARYLLVNLIIAPFRGPKSSKEYKKLWNHRGSPLKYYGFDIEQLLQQKLGKNYQVALAMRYQNPSLENVLSGFAKSGLDEIIIIPLFPQYASASTGSAIEEALRVINQWELIPNIKVISNFFEHPLFIKSFVEVGKKYMDAHHFDHYIFTYHGLPERQILKSSNDSYCKLGECCNTYHSKNKLCYRAQCFATTRLLVKELGLKPEQYSVCFQSRLLKDPWIRPYTDDVIKELGNKGVKSILAFSPSFIADCLETTIEGGEEYKELFEEHGGEHWQLVESLNAHTTWVDCLEDLVIKA
jgi:ferrochelatase